MKTFNMSKTALTLAALALTGLASAAAQAQTPILDFTSGFQSQAGTGGHTFGYSFTVTANTPITGLGVFDWNSDGLLANKIAVGLWDASGPTLLASTAITNASFPIASTSANGRWLEQPVAPFVLTPGTYVLGALYTNAGDFFASTIAIPSTIPGVTFGGAQYDASNNFVYPGTPDALDSPGYFGPTAFFGDRTSSVPEPGSVTLLVAGGLSCLMLRRRKA